MKATHLVTDTESGTAYEFIVSGDEFYWRPSGGSIWRGPCSGGLDGTYSQGEWVTSKINTFKGNK